MEEVGTWIQPARKCQIVLRLGGTSPPFLDVFEGCGVDGGRGRHADGESSGGEHADTVGLKKVSKESGGVVDSKPHGKERFCNDCVSGTGECAVIMVVGILARVLRMTREVLHLKAMYDLETFHVEKTGPGSQVGW